MTSDILDRLDARIAMKFKNIKDEYTVQCPARILEDAAARIRELESSAPVAGKGHR